MVAAGHEKENNIKNNWQAVSLVLLSLFQLCIWVRISNFIALNFSFNIFLEKGGRESWSSQFLNEEIFIAAEN